MAFRLCIAGAFGRLLAAYFLQAAMKARDHSQADSRFWLLVNDNVLFVQRIETVIYF